RGNPVAAPWQPHGSLLVSSSPRRCRPLPDQVAAPSSRQCGPLAIESKTPRPVEAQPAYQVELQPPRYVQAQPLHRVESQTLGGSSYRPSRVPPETRVTSGPTSRRVSQHPEAVEDHQDGAAFVADHTDGQGDRFQEVGYDEK